MTMIFKTLLTIFILGSVGIFTVQATPYNDWSAKLALKLIIDREDKNIKKDIVNLMITLVNKTDEKIELLIPVYPNQLFVHTLTKRGNNLRLNERLRRVGFYTDTNKAIVIKPKEKIIYKKRFDLTAYKDEIEGKSFVEFKANFILYRTHKKGGGMNEITSNTVKYTIPDMHK